MPHLYIIYIQTLFSILNLPLLKKFVDSKYRSEILNFSERHSIFTVAKMQFKCMILQASLGHIWSFRSIYMYYTVSCSRNELKFLKNTYKYVDFCDFKCMLHVT